MSSVSVVMPVWITEPAWQVPMTVCAVETLRKTGGNVEIVIVEADGTYCESLADRYLSRPKTTGVKDFNAGLETASGEFIVHVANDIFVRPGWKEAMLDCFHIPDCGVATVASSDICSSTYDSIMEGIYGPFMMFRKGWALDEQFVGPFSDADLILRQYKAGFRSYRNWRVRIVHLPHTSWKIQSKQEQDRVFNEAKQQFINKHQGCPLYVYRVFCEGIVM